MPEPMGYLIQVKALPFDPTPIRQAEGALKQFDMRVTEAQERMSMMVGRVGKVATAFSIGLTAALGLGVAEAIKVEESMLRIGMVASNLTSTDLRDLEDQFYKVAAVLPIDVEELARMGVVLAKLGVSSKAAIADMALLSTQFAEVGRMGREEAAESLVLLQRILGVEQKDVKRMASVIVELADSSAASAGMIVEVTKRFGSMGRQLGLTQAQILGLVPVLRGTGLQSQVLGTAVQKFFVQMSTRMGDFAKIAGVSAKDFRQRMEVDASGAMMMFLEGLNKTASSGADMITMLQKVGLTGGRVGPVVLYLASHLDEVRKFQDMAASSWAKGIALLEKYGLISKSTGAKIKILIGTIKSIAAQMGDVLKPILRAVLDVGIHVTAMFFSMPRPIKAAVAVLVVFAAAISGVIGVTFLFVAMQMRARASATRLAFALGNVNAALGLQSGKLGVASFMWGQYKTMLGTTWKSLSGGLRWVWRSITGFKLASAATWLWNAALYANPIGLVVAAVVAFVAVIGLATYALIKGSKWVKVWAALFLMGLGPIGMLVVQIYWWYSIMKRLMEMPVWEKITQAFKNIWAAVKLALSPLSEVTAWFQTAEGAAFDFDSILTSVGEAIAWVGNAIAFVIRTMVPAFEVARDAIQFLVDSLSFMVEDLTILGEDLWATFAENISMLWEPISEIFGLIGEIFGYTAGQGATTGEVLRRIFTVIMNFLVVPIKLLGVVFRVVGWIARLFGILAKAIAWVNRYLNPLVWMFRLMAWEIKTVKELLFGSSFLHIKEGIDRIKAPLEWLLGIITKIFGGFGKVAEKVKSTWQHMKKTVKEEGLIAGGFSLVKQGAKAAWGAIFGSSFLHIREGVRGVLPWMMRLGDQMARTRAASLGLVRPPAALPPPAPSPVGAVAAAAGVIREASPRPAPARGATAEITIPITVTLDGQVIYETVKKISTRELVRGFGEEQKPAWGIGV